MVISILLIRKLIFREIKRSAQEYITQLTELEFWPRLFYSDNRVPSHQDKVIEVDGLIAQYVYQFAEDYVLSIDHNKCLDSLNKLPFIKSAAVELSLWILSPVSYPLLSFPISYPKLLPTVLYLPLLLSLPEMPSCLIRPTRDFIK